MHFNCALSHSPCCTFCIPSASKDSSLYFTLFIFIISFIITYIVHNLYYIFSTSTSLCRFSYMQSPLFNSALEPSSCTSSLKALFLLLYILTLCCLIILSTCCIAMRIICILIWFLCSL